MFIHLQQSRGRGEGDEDPEEMHLQYVKEKQIKCEWAAKQGRKIDNQIKPSKCRCCHRNFPSRSNFWAHWNQVCQGKLLLLLRRTERTGTCYRIELILNVRNSIKSSFPGFSAAPRDEGSSLPAKRRWEAIKLNLPVEKLQ